MAKTLPTVGGDVNTWGTELNTYIESVSGESVQDHGAEGDGTTDDTDAIQACIDAVNSAGGGVVVFPPGNYSVLQDTVGGGAGWITVYPNIHLIGYGATMTIRDDAGDANGDFARIFSTQSGSEGVWNSDDDSEPTIIEGFTFDENLNRGGGAKSAFENYEKEHGGSVFIFANDSSGTKQGRHVVHVINCFTKNSPGAMFQLLDNAHLKAINCHVIDSWSERGLLAITGGYTIAELRGCTARSQNASGSKVPGVDIEINSASGYGTTRKCWLHMQDCYIEGKLDLGGGYHEATFDRCTFNEKQGINARILNLRSHADDPNGPMTFNGCILGIGGTDNADQPPEPTGRISLIEFVDTTFRDCKFVLYEPNGAVSKYHGVEVLGETSTPSRLSFYNCSFEADSSVEAGDTVRYFYFEGQGLASDDRRFVFRDCEFGSGVDYAFDIAHGELDISGCAFAVSDTAIKCKSTSANTLRLTVRDCRSSAPTFISNQIFSNAGEEYIRLSGNRHTGATAFYTETLSGGSSIPIDGDFNVRDFGASGDGSTDDTAEIQAAIDAVPSNGGTVYLPPGSYRITTALTVDDDDVTICGHRDAKIVLDPAGGETYKMAFYVDERPTTVNRLTIRDLSIVAKNAATSASESSQGIIQLNQVVDFLIKNVHISWDWSGGDPRTADNAGGFVFAHDSTGLVEGCTARETPKAGFYAAHCDEVIFSNCRSYDVGWDDEAKTTENSNGGSGFTIGASYCQLINCYAEGCSENGITVFRISGQDPPGHLLISNCHCNNITGDGLEFSGGSTVATAPHDVLVQNCEFDNNTSAGVRVLAGRKVRISNCSIHDNGASGFSFAQNATDEIAMWAIESCDIFNNSTTSGDTGIACFNVGGGSGQGKHGISILGCRLWDDQGTPTQVTGLEVLSTYTVTGLKIKDTQNHCGTPYDFAGTVEGLDFDVNVQDFGARGDDTADDQAAIADAATTASLGTGNRLIFPAGTYKISSNVTINSDVTCVFHEGAQIKPDAGDTVTINGDIIAGNHQIFGGSGTVTLSARAVLRYDRWTGGSSDLVIIGGGTGISKHLSATGALDFDLTSVVSEDKTITVTGAAVGDSVALGIPNGSVTADTIFIAWVSATNTVTVRAARLAGTPDPVSGTFRVDVWQH